MKKLGVYFIILMLSLNFVASSNLYNYVYNGSSWVPQSSTSDGQTKLWIEMKNSTYGNVVNDLTVGGKIGIGTTTPTNELTVIGDINVTGKSYLGDITINADDITVNNISGKDDGSVLIENNLFVNSNKIGIGTINPSHELNVIGNVNITGDLYVNASTIYIGNNSLSNVNGSITWGGVSLGSSTPVNAIMAFNQATCPDGWILADGTDGTPDLRGIFVRGAGNNSILNSNATYGLYYNDSFEEHVHGDGSLTAAGQTLNVANVALSSGSAALNGDHYHTFSSTNAAGSWVNSGYPATTNTATGAISSSETGAHTHTVSGSTDIDHTHSSSDVSGSTSTNGSTETIPNSYALIYCMKTAEDSTNSNSLWQGVNNKVQLANTSKTVEVNNLNVTGNVSGNLSVIGDVDLSSAGSYKSPLPMIIWRLNTTIVNNADPLGSSGSDWEIADNTENEFYLGSSTSVTESSGIFSFATTGYWSIRAYGRSQGKGGTDVAITFYLYSTDDDSTYTAITQATANHYNTDAQTVTPLEALIRVNDITLDKIKLAIGSMLTNTQFLGDPNSSYTYIVFEKKSDI
jgi:hypothetical protein